MYKLSETFIDEESAVCDFHEEVRSLLSVLMATDWTEEEADRISSLEVGGTLSVDEGSIVVTRVKDK